MSAGGLSCCSAALAAAARGTSLPWLRVLPKYATSRRCLAPHPRFLTLSLPFSSPQAMGLLAGEAEEDWTSFQCNFLGEQTALDLVSLLVGCQEGQLPSDIFGGGNHSGEASQYLQTHI